MRTKHSVSPKQDTGWGVIYRLNDLFKEIEVLAPAGKYDEWNFKLDRIFSNLCYRNKLKVIKDKEKKIIDIKFDEEPYNIKEFLDKKILQAKAKLSQAKRNTPIEVEPTKNKDYVIAKKELYKAIFLKEIWLRKYMYDLDLYLKEVEYNPATAMFGD